MTIFVLKIVQIAAALSILVLSFVAPKLVVVSIAVFGATMALMAAGLLFEGLPRRRFITRSGVVAKDEQSARYWAIVALNVLALVLGLAVTQLWWVIK